MISTVRQLIEQLQQYDLDCLLLVADNEEGTWRQVDVVDLGELKNGKKLVLIEVDRPDWEDYE